VRIRLGEEQDAAAVLAIYAPIVESTSISFETAVPSVDEMASRIVDRQPSYPWLVAEDDGGLAGYAYAGRFASRAAYGWSVETSVYVDERRRGQRVGSGLYVALLQILTAQGFRQVMAGISLPNSASVALHESMGFVRVGVYAKAGWKLGRWHDVGWWQQPLGDDRGRPRPARSLEELSAEVPIAAFTAGAAVCSRGSTSRRSPSDG
jgi:L-amino acid N-acyltransferase YncA